MQRARSRDDGVSTAIVVIIFGSLITAALLTMVGDLGQMYVERRELQNGADAAALAGAFNCAMDNPSLACGDAGTAAVTTSPTALVNANASDALGELQQLCVHRANASPADLNCDNVGYSNCLVAPTTTSPLTAGRVAYPNYVRVRTKTLTTSSTNPNRLAPLFERLINSGATGRSVSACAFAAWGGPSSLYMSMPIAMSTRCWDLVKAGNHFNPEPPYTGGPTTAMIANELAMHANQSSSTGSDWRNCMLADQGGAFGWLSSPNGYCVAMTGTSGSIAGQPGVSVDNNCKVPLSSVARSSNIVTVAIFDYTNGSTGSNLSYHVVGFAKFYVTGYDLPGMSPRLAPYDTTLQAQCTGNENCLYGWFLSPKFQPAPGVDPGQTATYGVTTVALVG